MSVLRLLHSYPLLEAGGVDCLSAAQGFVAEAHIVLNTVLPVIGNAVLDMKTYARTPPQTTTDRKLSAEQMHGSVEDTVHWENNEWDKPQNWP